MSSIIRRRSGLISPSAIGRSVVRTLMGISSSGVVSLATRSCQTGRFPTPCFLRGSGSVQSGISSIMPSNIDRLCQFCGSYSKHPKAHIFPSSLSLLMQFKNRRGEPAQSYSRYTFGSLGALAYLRLPAKHPSHQCGFAADCVSKECRVWKTSMELRRSVSCVMTANSPAQKSSLALATKLPRPASDFVGQSEGHRN
jgi:hypothetical protein